MKIYDMWLDERAIWRSAGLVVLSMLYTYTIAFSQTFPGEAGALIPPGAPGVTIGLTTAICSVSGVGIIGEGCTEIDNIAIDITHTYTGDLGIFLISPGGDVLELTSGNGGTGNNFTATVFTDTASLFITQGSAPYTGYWRPEGRQQSLTLPYPNTSPLGTYTLDNVFDGVDADGDWTLYINDFLLVDVGIINSWSITFTGGPGPVPEVDLGPDLLICEEQSATIVADVDPGADTWEWSSGETTSSITAAPAESTTYVVTVTNNGCTDTDTINVQVQPNTINADAGQDEEICEGMSVEITGSGGGTGATYEWSTGQQGPLIMVEPGSTTTYTLTVTDGVCSGTDEVEVAVLPNPVADAGPPMTMCDGMSVLLEATGGTQDNDYLWSTGENGESILVDPFVTTTYTVTVTVDGCEDEDDVEVTVIPQPYVDAGEDMTICAGETVTLSATGTGGMYEWSTGQTESQISVSPSAATTYIVSLTQDGCTATDEVDVDVISLVPAVSPDQTICEGETAILTASGGAHYLWSTGDTTPVISVSPTTTAGYSVTISLGPCNEVLNAMVHVFPSPVAGIVATGEICSGDSVLITATGGTTYVWSTGSAESAFTAGPSTTTTYTVTVTDQGCSDIDSVIITVHPSPVITIGPPVSVCEGETIDLQVTGLSGNEELIWNTGDTLSVVTVSPLADVVYSVTATDPFGCMDESEISVTVLPVPVANAGSDIFIMSGGAATLTASGMGNYVWSTGEMTTTIVVMPTITTTYSLTATLNGCTDTDEVTVFVNEVPPVELGDDLFICPGEAVTLNAIVPGPFMLGYQWSTGETDSSITVAPLVDSTFLITVTDLVSGFFSIDSIHVFVGSLPVGLPVISGPAEGCLLDIESFVASGVFGATSYTWVVSGGNLLSGQGSAGIMIEWTTIGAQSIMLIVSNECGSLPAVSFDADILTAPVLTGQISGLASPCVFAPADYSIASLPGALSYNWYVTGGGLIISGQGTTDITVDWNGALAGALCIEAINACGVSSPLCLDVMPAHSPNISAGPDLETCEQTINLQGLGNGTWDILSGAGIIDLADVSDPGSGITSLSPGTSILVFQNGTAGCEASDTVLVTFWPAPSISHVIEECSMDMMTFSVSFEIAGGQPPYSVNDSLVSANQFISAPVLAGSSYVFQVEDGHGCLSPVVTGRKSCDCVSSLGWMDQELSAGCVGDSLVASYPAGMVIGMGDTLAFVLHDGLIPDGIIAWSHQPAFPYVSGLLAEKTYYISAVAGLKGPDGFPLRDDPCFMWNAGTPFLFFEPPVVDLGPDLSVHPGESVQLEASSSSVIILYNWFGSDTCMQCPSILVSPVETQMFQVEVLDEHNCLGSDQLVLTVNAPKDIYLPNVFSPNGDQVNDEIGIAPHPSVHSIKRFEVYDRWGNLVFLAIDQLPDARESKWDGTYRESIVNPGVYTCMAEVELRDGTIRLLVWDVTLIR